MKEGNIITTKIANTKFYTESEQRPNNNWDVYMIDPDTEKRELLKENITTESFNKFLDHVSERQTLLEKYKANNKPTFTTGDKVTWAILIILILWGVFNMGQSSDKVMTPAEVREENTRCREWTGKDCDPYSAN